MKMPFILFTNMKLVLLLYTYFPQVRIFFHRLQLAALLDDHDIGYVDELIQETVHLCEGVQTSTMPIDVSESLSSTYERPSKAEAVRSHKSKFLH